MNPSKNHLLTCKPGTNRHRYLTRSIHCSIPHNYILIAQTERFWIRICTFLPSTRPLRQSQTFLLHPLPTPNPRQKGWTNLKFDPFPWCRFSYRTNPKLYHLLNHFYLQKHRSHRFPNHPALTEGFAKLPRQKIAPFQWLFVLKIPSKDRIFALFWHASFTWTFASSYTVL